MNKFTIGVLVVSSFFFGRLSVFVVQNRYLKEKERYLNSYRKEISAMAKELRETDKTIRKKWQAMVSDVSQYEFDRRPDKNKWTDIDDRYLESWSSAEKSYFQENTDD